MPEICIYKCNICGNVVQILVNGHGELVCCGESMEKIEPKTQEENITEKHVPIFINSENNSTEIRVGEVLHPMLPEHYIMFIETVSDDENSINIKFLHPDDEPKMFIKNKYKINKALEYCNIHGLWEGKND